MGKKRKFDLAVEDCDRGIANIGPDVRSGPKKALYVKFHFRKATALKFISEHASVTDSVTSLERSLQNLEIILGVEPSSKKVLEEIDEVRARLKESRVAA